MKLKKRVTQIELRLSALEQELTPTKKEYCCGKNYAHSHHVKVKGW